MDVLLLQKQLGKFELVDVKKTFVAEFQCRDDQQCHERKSHERGSHCAAELFGALIQQTVLTSNDFTAVGGHQSGDG